MKRRSRGLSNVSTIPQHNCSVLLPQHRLQGTVPILRCLTDMTHNALLASVVGSSQAVLLPYTSQHTYPVQGLVRYGRSTTNHLNFHSI